MNSKGLLFHSVSSRTSLHFDRWCPENLRGFVQVWFLRLGAQAIKRIYKKGKESSSGNASRHGRKEAEGQDGDNMEIVDVPVTDSADSEPVQKSTTVKVRAFNVGDYSRQIFLLKPSRLQI